MKTFTDKKKRKWEIEVTVGTVKRVRDLIDVDLVKVLEGDLIERLRLDPELLVNVIYALCKPQADERKISDEDFGQAMNGLSIDGALAALFVELADFFPSPTRQLIHLAAKKTESLTRIAIETAAKAKKGTKMETKLKRKLQKLIAGPASTSSPARSASSPGRSRGASSSK